MPGISIFTSNSRSELSEKKVEDNILEQNFLEAIEYVKHDKRYAHKIILRQNSFLVAYTGYPEYPLTTFEDDEFWVCVEGKIYGKNDSQVKKEINILLNKIVAERFIDKSDKFMDNWLLTTDGEFIIYAFDKRHEDFIVLNDALGRLPLYYYNDPDDTKIIISREIHLIAALIWDNQHDGNKKHDRFDRTAIVDYLLLGLMLESHTLLTNVYRLRPATVIRLYNNTKIDIQNIYTFNFEQKKYVDKSIKENSNKLISLFSDACLNRADPNGNNVISLSGGFDSRAVAACFYKNNIPFSTATYVPPGWKPSVDTLSEVEIAKQVANEFQSKCENFGLVEPRAEDLLMLLKIKCGLNYLGFGYMIPILDKLIRKYDTAITFFTGDGGDRSLHELRFGKIPRSIDELIKYIVRDLYGASYLFSIRDVAAVTDMSEKQIIDRLRRVLTSYPEKRLDQKLVHFIFYESAFSDDIESEDRNRTYVWSVTPFYSIPFFHYAMNCSDSNKANIELQREFLLTLSPAAAAIKNSAFGCSLTSKKYKIIQRLITLRRRYPTLKRVMDRIRCHKNYEYISREIKCLRDQIYKSESIRNYFNQDKLNDILNNPKKYNATGISALFTIVSLMESLSSTQSTLAKYYL
jgi:asparagine synthase (glutamine-hydrolysing)